MSLLDPRAWGAAILALAIAVGGGYLLGRHDGKAIAKAAAQEEMDQWQANANVAYDLYLKARDQKEIRYRTITKTVEVAKNATPDIPDCRTGDDWMQIYRDNAAIANGATVPASAGNADRANAR
ncbi:hypothetical protein [Cupriavidus metallidurans]|uniref:hypothetical protein n=1 Tax=Cupriavidus metallidurans TaxID=119219 RepID=UPI0035C6D7DF